MSPSPSSPKMAGGYAACEISGKFFDFFIGVPLFSKSQNCKKKIPEKFSFIYNSLIFIYNKVFMRKSVRMKNNISLNETQLRNVIHKTIAKILTENANINDYVNLEPTLRAFGKDVVSMAYAIADYLFEAGLDCYKFTHHLEKRFETLNAESKKGDATVMGLISAIKNSKTYLDVTSGWE